MGPFGLVVFGVLVVSWALRAWAIGRLRRGDHRASSPFVVASVVFCVSALAIAIWTAVRIPILGVPLTIGVLVLAGVWLRQASVAALIAGGNRGSHERLDRLVGSASGGVRLAASAVLGAGFIGIVALIVYLLFRSRF